MHIHTHTVCFKHRAQRLNFKFVAILHANHCFNVKHLFVCMCAQAMCVIVIKMNCFIIICLLNTLVEKFYYDAIKLKFYSNWNVCSRTVHNCLWINWFNSSRGIQKKKRNIIRKSLFNSRDRENRERTSEPKYTKKSVHFNRYN